MRQAKFICLWQIRVAEIETDQEDLNTEYKEEIEVGGHHIEGEGPEATETAETDMNIIATATEIEEDVPEAPEAVVFEIHEEAEDAS